jgi:cation diffusion facilitator CzcD-associated flavoprotein CzcO
MSHETQRVQVAIIGGGQAGLGVGYYLKRQNVSFVIYDEQPTPGGAWLHTWDSLRLFSPASYSSLPGWIFPQTQDKFPSRDEVIHYLTEYEKRYELTIQRPVSISSIKKSESGLLLSTGTSEIEATAVVSCTGTWKAPFIPQYSGQSEFKGLQIHSANYRTAEQFRGMKVLIVGGGNSGAQILAEVSKIATTTWVTEREPKFLPDDVDGRVLFDVATKRYEAAKEGRSAADIPSLGDVVMIDSVKDARARGVLKSVRPFERLTSNGAVWSAEEKAFDAIIWCTGFKAALSHLQNLNVIESSGKVEVSGTRSVKEPRLWLVGYGEWTGFGSATLIGSQRYARKTAEEVRAFLSPPS